MHSSKQEFRKLCRALKTRNRYYYSKKVGKALYPLLRGHKNILFFIPTEGEADIGWVIKKLRREKKNIFVPFMEGLSFKMVKYQLPLKKKKFNILEPHNKRSVKQKITTAVVPAVGVDCTFRRIGFGKGMYDRFFDKLGYTPVKVFVQLKPCYSRDVLTEPHDIAADIYVSFNIVKRRKNDGCNNFSSYDIIRSRGVLHSKKNGYGKIRHIRGAGKGQSKSY